MQPDGKILVFGDADSSDGQYTALTRFNSDGTRDFTFGLLGNGVVTLDPSGLKQADASRDPGSLVALSPVDGKIVIVAYAPFAAGAPPEIFVARYLP